MELPIINYIKTLSPRDRIFYLLMRSYENDLTAISKLHSLNTEYIQETLEGIKELYELELASIVSSPVDLSTHNHNVNNNKKITSIIAENPIPLYQNNEDIDEFAKSLGPWASSFSSSTDCEPNII